MSPFDFMPHTHALWERGGAAALPAARSLSAVCRNVLEHPTVLRYRRLRAEGAASSAFQTRIAGAGGALDVLVICGFER
jgi:hypothetical protein